MFPNYSWWFGLWSLVHLLDMFVCLLVHLEGTLFVSLCRPFYMIIWHTVQESDKTVKSNE